MRFEVVTLPDIVNRRLTDSLAGGHQPATPMAHPFGFCAQSRIHDCLNLPRSISCLTAASRRHFPQTIQTFLLKTRAPQCDSLAIGLQVLGDTVVGLPLSSGQHDPAPQGYLLRRAEGRDPLAKLLLVGLFQ